MLIYKISDSIVFNALKNIRNGYLTITKINGELLKFGNPADDLKVSMTIKDESFNYYLIKSGSIGLGECYMKNFFTTNNLSDLIELTARNIKIIYKFSGIFDLPLFNYFKNKIIKNTKNRSKENIAKHYDLGNDFFSLWLDKTLTYSSAVFENSKQDLLEAQNNKYQKLINLLKPSNGSKILEIGCGWGGFAEIAAKEFKCNVVGLTLSKEQASFARDRMAKAQLSNLVDIRIQDYRDVQGSYDKIVSIEMFEAVGQEHWNNYFSIIGDRLKRGGKAAIQSITIADPFFDKYKKEPDFIQKYIFPGGVLPSPTAFNSSITKAGLVISDAYFFGKSYAETLRRWQKTFDYRWDDIEPLGFDERFRRMWKYYLSYCEAGFENGHIDVGQFVIDHK